MHSRAGQSDEQKRAYVARLVDALRTLGREKIAALETIYFGGGSPALCDLTPLFDILKPALKPTCEFTIELHPLDVTPALLQTLKNGGVNRISMGVQSLDDETLRDMGRGYTFAEAEQAFAWIKRYFDNAGIDLIVGYPSQMGGDASLRRQTRGPSPFHKVLSPRWARLAKWGLAHCSVYSLILEDNSLLGKRMGSVPTGGRRIPASAEGSVPLGGLRIHASTEGALPLGGRRILASAEGTVPLPSDEEVLNQIAVISRFLSDIGLERYEISNYARPGFECRHNLATWRGEDYYGLGDGAHGRIGFQRTQNWWGRFPLPTQGCVAPQIETVTAEADRLERTIFRLRTREGLDARAYPQWIPLLDDYAAKGLVTRVAHKTNPVYRLTERGTEVCDAILADLV